MKYCTFRLLVALLCAAFGPFAPAQLVRTANTTLNLPASLPPATGYATENALGGLTFNNPICIASPPGETDRLFVVQRDGSIALVTGLNSTPVKQSTLFLRLSDIPGLVVSNVSRTSTEGECGFLSMAFHPNYATNGYFFIFYSLECNTGSTANPDWRRFQRVARLKVSTANPNVADPASHTPLITQYDEYSNHNGGDLLFGNDGYLYATFGDEGNANDFPGNNARFINKDFFGCIVRLDVDNKPASLSPNAHAQAVPTSNGGTNPYPSAIGAGTYKIPPDNPFIGATSWHNATISPSSVRTEIFATGLRNPYRFSCDPVTGRIFAGDVGQSTREEIDLITKGGDYGWSWREGTFPFTSGPSPTTPPTSGFNPIGPIHDYPRSDGYSVTGGQIMRSSRFPELAGKYIFADYGLGNVWTLTENSGVWTRANLTTQVGLVEFGTDPRNNDLLICGLGSAAPILRLTRSYTGTPPPATLSATGAFSNLTTLTPQPGVVPYDLNVSFWSDYAIKSRWFAIKNLTDTVTFSPTANWTFPTGLVWVKHFDFENTRGNPATKRKLETRFIVKTSSGIYGITYRWRADQTDADLVEDAGLSENLNVVVNGQSTTQVWRYPSRGECLTCHTAQGGLALSFNTPQINHNHTYGSQTQNQIAALSQAGYFSSPVSNVNTLTAFAAATDTTQSLEWRVRSYLSVNCVQCHQPGGSGVGNWDARSITPTDAANLINGVLVDNLGDGTNRFAVPADLTHSMLIKRLQAISAPRMPPLASNEIDPGAIQLVSDWINQFLPSRQSFSQWQTTNFNSTSIPNAAANADPDGDGQSNSLEFLTHTNPASSASRWPPLAPTIIGSNLQFSYVQPANRSALVEVSDDLGSWSLLDIAGNTPTFPPSNQVRLFSAPSSDARKFYRVRLSDF